MDKSKFFSGRQIKNYLVGFASIFSEIPFRDRKGLIKTVPIHYGSPSDVMSHLETNVDNEETKNRNRLKDISIPLFSFRMTGIERNVEKRRNPHVTTTVDLRSLGYNVGYVTMWPAPFKFTMELVLWASSDYEAFEITEQIIPYFNSPQQVIIAPLPGCRVNTTEVNLDNIEIDTDPEAQKYSALVTMTFSLTGWLLTQPKLWSTNLEFELSMLGSSENVKGFAGDVYDFDNKIIDMNETPVVKPKDTSLDSFENFITNSPELLSEYGEKFEWYKLLAENARIDENGVVVDTTELTVDYKDAEITFDSERILTIAEEIDDLRYVYENAKLSKSLANHTTASYLKILDELMNDDGDTIDTYLKLLDYNLATKGFNKTDVPITNSEKLDIFGTVRVDEEYILGRMRNYLAAFENMKVKKETFLAKGIITQEQTILDNKFVDLDEYIIAQLYHNIIEDDTRDLTKMLEVITAKFGLSYDDIVSKSTELEEFINRAKEYINVNLTDPPLVSDADLASGQQTIVGDLAQAVVTDNDGRPIYDANNDGLIDATDLELLNANVDNPEDYNFKVISGLWHKITPEGTVEPPILALDIDGNPIYDANDDGLIDEADLELLGSNVENPDDYKFKLVDGLWYKVNPDDTTTPIQ